METIEMFLLHLGENPYLQALGILLVSLVLAKLADWIFTRGLIRLTQRTPTEIDDHMVEMIHKPIFYSVLAGGLALALARVEFLAPLHFVGFGLIKTLVIVIWLISGIRLILLILDWMTQQPHRFHIVQPDTQPLFDIGSRIILFGGALYLLLISWSVDVTAWLASAGILGIAVGFAAKDTLANLFAGVFILADAPYKIGDVIVLDGGERGHVTKIGIRSTRILTRDDVEITIPNATIGNSKIINESGGPYVKFRNRIPVGVAYGSDVDLVRKILLEVAQEAAKEGSVALDPEPRVRFRGFGDFALNFELLYWIKKPVLKGRVQDLLNTLIYKALVEANVEIPYPKTDLYLKEMPEGRNS